MPRGAGLRALLVFDYGELLHGVVIDHDRAIVLVGLLLVDGFSIVFVKEVLDNKVLVGVPICFNCLGAGVVSAICG